MGLKKGYFLIDVRIYIFDICQDFLIQPLLLKGLNKDSLEICDLSWDVKMENDVLGKIQKNTRHKTGTHFKHTTVNT